MTKEQIEKLNKLQSDIQKAREAVDVLRRHPEYSVKPYKYSSYYTYPLDLVPGLQEEIHAWLFDQFLGRSLELEEQLRELVVCKEEKGETKFTPTDL